MLGDLSLQYTLQPDGTVTEDISMNLFSLTISPDDVEMDV
jgi:hypothetical protein